MLRLSSSNFQFRKKMVVAIKADNEVSDFEHRGGGDVERSLRY